LRCKTRFGTTGLQNALNCLKNVFFDRLEKLMPVYSMTGYASVQSSNSAPESNEAARPNAEHPRIGLEIRSVNSRFLDLSFRLSDELRHCEPALRELLTQGLKRGKVELRAFVGAAKDSATHPPSAALLQRLNHAQDSVLAWLPNARPLSVADVLRLAGNDHGSSAHVTDSDIAEQVLPIARQALTDLLASREREGARLAEMLLGHTAQLRALAKVAAPLIPQLVEQQKQKFVERFMQALSASDASTASPISQQAAHDRALTEATAFAIRIDVAEEITRLSAHLEEIERLLSPAPASTGSGKSAKTAAKSVEIGKRLDFVIQELHREANTLGSKSSTLDITRTSVDMKVLIEQMREQVQNIE
jgi:uncharacterized protein (TIGR00255 family)